MLQAIAGKIVYIVDFPSVPQPPITGNGWERPYADALTEALVTHMIVKPGKYAVHVDFSTWQWEVYEVINQEPSGSFL